MACAKRNAITNSTSFPLIAVARDGVITRTDRLPTTISKISKYHEAILQPSYAEKIFGEFAQKSSNIRAGK